MTEQKKMKRRPVTHLTVTATQRGVIPHDEMIVNNSKHAVGRPSKYTHDMCDRVVEMGRQGYSATHMAASLHIHRHTLKTWCKAHPEFLDAFQFAMTASQAWWEHLALKALELPARAFNAGLWGKIMSARFPDTYRKTARPEPSGFEGKPIPVAVVHAPMTRAELAEWYKQFTNGWRK